jgi:DNA relaxase NicK
MSLDSLKTANLQILSQLEEVLEQLHAQDFSMPLDILSGNTIGMHVRHILELYQEFFTGIVHGEINYDKRKRNLTLQEDLETAIWVLKDVKAQVKALQNETALVVKSCFVDSEIIQLPSSLSRELAYNLEHSIHHMAILQICFKQYFPKLILPAHFGVAYATVQYQSKNVYTELPAATQ